MRFLNSLSSLRLAAALSVVLCGVGCGPKPMTEEPAAEAPAAETAAPEEGSGSADKAAEETETTAEAPAAE